MAEAGSAKKRPSKSKGRTGKAAAKKPSAGRPEFKPTDKQRLRVEILIGGGMAVDEVAAALEVDKKTLAKHFSAEIKHGRARKRAEVLEAMFNAAKGGNVSAQKAFIALNTLADADASVQGEKDDLPAAPKQRTPFKGKKEVAQEEALTAGIGSEWGSDLDPSVRGPDVKPN